MGLGTRSYLPLNPPHTQRPAEQSRTHSLLAGWKNENLTWTADHTFPKPETVRRGKILSIKRGRKRIFDILLITTIKGFFPDGSMVKNPLAMPETQKTWVQSLCQEDPLGEGMATHCSILAWRPPWIEEPGGLQSMGSQSWTQLNTQPLLKSLAFNSMWVQKLPCAVPSVLSVHQFVLAHVCPLPYLNQGQNLPALGNTTYYFLNLDSSCPWPTAAGLCGSLC